MTKKEVELLTKIGPKGQIVLRKEIRKALGIRPGSIVRTKLIGKEVRIKPLTDKDIEKEIREIEKIAKLISKRWPKGITAVEAIREQRR
jgi:AbrB family looped-hinge helix DNA binding protein